MNTSRAWAAPGPSPAVRHRLRQAPTHAHEPSPFVDFPQAQQGRFEARGATTASGTTRFSSGAPAGRRRPLRIVSKWTGAELATCERNFLELFTLPPLHMVFMKKWHILFSKGLALAMACFEDGVLKF